MSPLLGSFGGLTARAFGLGGFTPSSAKPIIGAYDALATVTVPSGGASSITFSGIPSTYTHLQIRAMVINSASTTNVQMRVGNNGIDSGSSSYAAHQLNGNGSTASAGGGGPSDHMDIAYTNNSVSAFIIDITDYASIVKNKTLRSIGGYDNNGSGWVQYRSGLWMNSTQAITDLYFTPSGTSFAQYSTFSLYGVR